MKAYNERVLISIPPGLLDEADSFAKDQYMNRSELIRAALLAFIRTKKETPNA